MTPESVLTLGQEALKLTSLLSAPLLLTGLAIGLLVSIFQAATQINEMTLSAVPKLIATVLVLIATGPWMLEIMMEFTKRLFTDIPHLIG